MRATLTVLSGPFAGQTIAVAHGKLLIGREVDCHLQPDSALVSRHHCVLLLDEYTLRIRDLGSKNGTFVNSRRIGASETILLHEDLVSIGDMVCQIDLTSETIEVQPAVTEAQPAASPPALEGTGIIEGDTVRAEDSSANSPSSPSQASSPVSPSTADTPH